MKQPGWIQLLREARYQGAVLGNHRAAERLLVELEGQYGRDPEALYHLRELASWLTARKPQNPKDALGRCETVLLDRGRSGKAFVASFQLARRDGGRLLASDYGARFRDAIRTAEFVVLRQLVQDQAFVASGTAVSELQSSVEGPEALGRCLKEGGSIGAAAAVAFYSFWTDNPAPGDLVVCGALGRQGELMEVAELPEKVRTVLRERPALRKLVIPLSGELGETDPRIIRVGTCQELLREVFGESRPRRVPLDLEATLDRALELYQRHNNYPAAEQLFSLALAHIAERRRGDPTAYRREEFVALWRRGSTLVHQGELSEATAAFGKARALGRSLWQEGVLDPASYLGFCGSLAVLLRDAYRYDEAQELLESTLASQRRLRMGRRELAKTLGNLGELHSFCGRFEQARAVLKEARAALQAAYPEELPRAFCNEANLALFASDFGRALSLCEQGLVCNASVQKGAAANEAFLRYSQARSLLALGRHEECAHLATKAGNALSEQQPYPRQLLLLCAGIAHWQQGRRDLARRILMQSAELSFVDGELLRFGVQTALGHRALLELAVGEEQRALAVVAPFAASVHAVPGLHRGIPLARAITKACQRGDASALPKPVTALIACFPYGVACSLYGGQSSR